jgi:hypothetical protein
MKYRDIKIYKRDHARHNPSSIIFKKNNYSILPPGPLIV